MQSYVNMQTGDEPDHTLLHKLESEHYHRRRLNEVFKLISELYWFRYVTDTVMCVFRAAIIAWVSLTISSMTPELQLLVGDQKKVKQIIELMEDRFDLMRGLQTEQQVCGHARRHLNVLQYIEEKVGPRKDDVSYNLMMYEWVSQLMRADKFACEHILASSDLMKSGTLMQEPSEISSFMHGSQFRKHPYAKRFVPTSEQQLPVVRVIIIAGHDGVELRNALGQVAGKHEASGMYGAIGNIPAPDRFRHKYMAPIQTVNENTIKRCTPTRVFSGADPKTGKLIDTDRSSIGAQSRTEVFLTEVSSYSNEHIASFRAFHAAFRGCLHLAGSAWGRSDRVEPG